MVTHFRELRVYRRGMDVAMQLFELSKGWPKEERYALTDQARRSSRAVCANVAEAWGKRRYPRHFVSKLTDADAEARETQAWIEIAVRCGYIERDAFYELDDACEVVIGSLVKMMQQPDPWCGPSALTREPERPYYICDPGQ
ncbi:MAG: four helix bundle protein [Bacteroidota bacterium]